jgi:hypothetical protein
MVLVRDSLPHTGKTMIHAPSWRGYRPAIFLLINGGVSPPHVGFLLPQFGSWHEVETSIRDRKQGSRASRFRKGGGRKDERTVPSTGR